MKAAALALFALLAAALPASLLAVSGTPVYDSTFEPNGYAQITNLTTSVSLPSIPSNSRIVLIQAQSQSIRWRDDGTDPTAAVGMLLEAGQTLVYNGNLLEIELIETTPSAVVNLSFYK